MTICKNQPGCLVCAAARGYKFVMSRFSANTRPRAAVRAVSVLILSLCFLPLLRAQEAHNYLANSTVLVIRHAEKPAEGAGLTPEGVARSEKYVRYFHPFLLDGKGLSINALYAGADTPDSVRPRLTLEPLSKATGIPLNVQFPTGKPEKLALALTTEPHGDHVLIAWRHKKIPALLTALGADPAGLLPGGVWPGSQYGWVIVLHYDAAGHLDGQRLIHEPDPLP